MRKEKQLLLNEIKEKINGSTAMIITRYEKLAPNTLGNSAISSPNRAGYSRLSENKFL